MAAAGDFVKGRWLRQGRARAGPQTPGTWELGQTTTSGSPAAGADFGVCRGRAPPGCFCRLDKAHTRVPPLALLRSAPACGFEAHEREGQDGRRGAPHPSRQRSAARGACPQPAPALAARRCCQCREPMSVPAHPAAASARVNLQGLRLRERRLTAAQRWRAAVIPPAPADNEPKAGVSQAAGALTASW